MAVDRNRIAAALAYEEEKRRMMESVPRPGQVQAAPPSRNLRRDLENLSIGIGEGLTNQLEGIKGIVTDPLGAVKGAYETVKGVVRDPRVLADALRYTAQKAGSGPLGAGEVIGEMVSPMRGKPVMAEIDVYHGTPHRFPPTENNPLGEFDASKIGTGEGAQAYGLGIYTAENPSIANDYRYNLSAKRPDRVTLDGKPISTDTAKGRAIEKMGLVGKQSALQSIDDNIRFNENYAPDMANLYREIRKEIEVIDPERVNVNRGNLYTADLPDEMVDRMLDWDKPLKEQPAAVREAFQDIMQSNLWDEDTRKLISRVAIEADEITGKKLYELLASSDELAGKGQFGKAASQELARRGVPGIRYLDAGSRGQGGTGTRNFVVFPGEEKKVKILKRE